uniref:Uncharacterized protein n=1 Tax=Wuhan astro-like virus TaxID=2116423 RepID=A0A2P1GMB3_9VIRU|nr:hypothetical protein [Wuhan astro-like virus]
METAILNLKPMAPPLEGGKRKRGRMASQAPSPSSLRVDGIMGESSSEARSKSVAFPPVSLRRGTRMVSLILSLSFLMVASGASSATVTSPVTAGPCGPDGRPKPNGTRCFQSNHNGTGWYLNVTGSVVYGKLPCANLSKPNCSLFAAKPAMHCLCHRGVKWCDGYLPNWNKQKPVQVKGHVCVIVQDGSCWGGDTTLDCHRPHTHKAPPPPVVTEVVLLVVCIVLFALLSVRCCVDGVVRRRPHRWCRWNVLLWFLLLLANRWRGVKTRVMQPGSCDGDVCLRSCERLGKCDYVGNSVVAPDYAWRAEAWCWHHECCEIAHHEVSIFKCMAGLYGWSSSCGVAREGCYWCGVKISGRRVEIHQCVWDRQRCFLAKGGKVVTVEAPISQRTNYICPEEQCVSNPPHWDKGGIWRYNGDFSCDCPDPWHCSTVGGISLSGICLENARVSVVFNQGKESISESVEVNVTLPHCAEKSKTGDPNGRFPCEKDGKFCWDKDCKLLDALGTSSYTEQFWTTSGGMFDFSSWCAWCWFIDLRWIAIFLLLFLLLLRR